MPVVFEAAIGPKTRWLFLNIYDYLSGASSRVKSWRRSARSWRNTRRSSFSRTRPRCTSSSTIGSSSPRGGLPGPKALANALALDSPKGAFYTYIGWAALIGAKRPAGSTFAGDVAVTKYMLDEAYVGSVTGFAHGLSPFFRISTDRPDDVLSDTVNRIAAASSRLDI